MSFLRCLPPCARAGEPDAPDPQRFRPLLRGEIGAKRHRGSAGEALRILREDLLPVFERLGDARERAVTMGRIADILVSRGDLDEALRIRREEQLPVYERLGDVRERAVTMGRIAHVLLQKGDVGAARALQEERLEINRRLPYSATWIFGDSQPGSASPCSGMVGSC